MFNPNITYHNTQSLILPQKSFGKKTLNNAYNTIAGLMAWRDAKKQAEKQEEALKKQEEWREKIFKEWQARNNIVPTATPVEEEKVASDFNELYQQYNPYMWG